MTPLDRELACWRSDRDTLAALLASQLPELRDPAEIKRLANICQRIAELEDEADIARIAADTCEKQREERERA